MPIVMSITACTSLRSPNIAQPFDGNYTPVIQKLSTFIKSEMKSNKLTGLSIALVDKDKMVWSEGFGLADKEKNIRATNKTRYRAASISKLFNAVAIMQQVERGELNLDAPVSEYIPDFKINSRFGSTDNITLRNLLTHHSGLPETHTDDLRSSSPVPLENILDSLSASYTAYPANTYSAYSNIGVSLSGLAVQVQSGEEYADYMQEHVLTPLQMFDSKYSKQVADHDTAIGYANGRIVKPLSNRYSPAGGLISNVDDMANFIIAMLGKGQFGETQLLSLDSYNEMLRIQNTDVSLDLSTRVGLGWFYNYYKLKGMFEVVGHSGSKYAHTSLLSMVPELGIGVIVLTNNAERNGSKERIVRAALEQLLITRGIHDIQLSETKPHREVAANPILPGVYAGTEGLVKISRKKNRLYASSLIGNELFILSKKRDNWYAPRYTFKGFPLPVVDDARVTGSTLDTRNILISQEDGFLKIVGERIEPQPESNIWSARLGYYKSKTLEEPKRARIDGATIRYADGYYLLDFFRKSTHIRQRAVQPISDSELVELGIGRGYGNTITYSELSGTPTLSILGSDFEFEAPSLDHLSFKDQ